MSIAVIGCGVAGTLVCLELLKQGKSPSKITIIDPYLDGGALSRHYTAICSNTRWEQITEAMKEYPSAQKYIEELNEKYTPESCVMLSDLGYLIQESLRSYLLDLNVLLETCNKITESENGWNVFTGSGIRFFETVILCQGGIEKQIDFGKPIIPLEIALDPSRLSRMIRPNQSVAVFGLAHSGTLVCKHLLALGGKVYGIYKNEKPFLFARDDEYDGIKQESAEIADTLLKNPPSNFELISYKDTPKLVKVINKVHWIVSAVGFDSSPIQIFKKDGQIFPFEKYDPETGKIDSSLYGFGLAYPGVTVYKEKTYKDVSIPSFVSQIRRCLPSILSKS